MFVTVTLAFALAAVAYTLAGLAEDPFVMRLIVPRCILPGLEGNAALIACGNLIGQQAPVATRGTIIGWYQVFGGIGITACMISGGLLFDRIAPTAPFLMMGTINTASVPVWLVHFGA